MERRKFLHTLSASVLLGTVFGTPLMARGRRQRRQRSNTSNTTLTSDQEAVLLHMYQEEKVARDVYSTLGRKYPAENTFANIQLSEQKHIDAVEVLCNKYGVDISAVNEDVIGEFVLPELQELYDVFVERGNESLIDALYVGRDIEIMDIEDLVTMAVGMPDDVQQVFSNLKAGSENHLVAFNRAISRNS